MTFEEFEKLSTKELYDKVVQIIYETPQGPLLAIESAQEIGCVVDKKLFEVWKHLSLEQQQEIAQGLTDSVFAQVYRSEGLLKLIGQGNFIHKTSIIDPLAKIGSGNFIGPFCMIGPHVTIGDNNMFVAYCSIGLPAEHRDYFEKYGKVEIGNDNVVREFTTINSSTTGITRMGNNCTMLRGAHLSHDSILEDDITLSCDVLVGGESHIMRGANVGLGAIMHQRSLIGSYSMIGMGSVITKKCRILPGRVYVGSPAEYLKDNMVGLERAQITGPQLEVEIQRFRALKGLK